MEQKNKELELVKKFKENNYECNIIINEAEPYTLYQANQIGKLLGIKKIRNTIKNYNNNERNNINTFDNINRNQNTTFLTYNGLIKLIKLSRKNKSYEISKNIGIDTLLIKYICVETDTLNNIKMAFSEEETILQYPVNNYRIDLYFPKYKLAIECDEEHYNLIKDKERENKIKDEIYECEFIRYKPYKKDFNIFKVINEINKYIKEYYIQEIETIKFINKALLDKEKFKNEINEIKHKYDLELQKIKL